MKEVKEEVEEEEEEAPLSRANSVLWTWPSMTV
jgi:hypothetical protein